MMHTLVIRSFLLIPIIVVLSGCVGAAPLFFMGAGATAGVVGTGVYNASQDEKDKGLTVGRLDVPMSMTFRCSLRQCKQAIVEVLVESGDTVDASTDTFIRTNRNRVTEELGAISSVLGGSEVYATKSITLAPSGRSTKVTISVDLYRKTAYTEEAKKEWPEQEAAVRRQFFDALSDKIGKTSVQTDADDRVRFAQRRLRELGYDPGVADGIYGQRTKDAVKAFQRDSGIVQTGRLDRETMERLQN